MQGKKRRTNADRRAATRGDLIAAARHLFVSKGYAETATPEIVKTANVTRGALYHHFEDKADLFRAVAEVEAQQVATAIDAHAQPAADPIDALLDGAEAYFDAMETPGRAYLLLVEAPVVLGQTGARDLSQKAGQAELELGLAALSRNPDYDVGTMASLLSAMFDSAALAIAQGAPRAPYRAAMRSVLAGLAA